MNLTNYKETPIAIVYDMVRSLAATYGVAIAETRAGRSRSFGCAGGNGAPLSSGSCFLGGANHRDKFAKLNVSCHIFDY